MNLGALIGFLKLAQDTGFTPGYRAERPDFIWGPKKATVSVIKPTAKKITISIGQTPLIVPVGFELVGPSIIGLRRPKGLD